MKTHWKKLNNPNYLGAYSLGDSKEMKVTIEKVVKEMITGNGGKKEECTIAYLSNEKPMILNSTNCKIITKNLGTPFIEDWQGVTITLYVALIKAFGEDNVEALRVKSEKKLPDFTPKNKKWNEAKKALLNNQVTIEQIRKKYTLTPENEKLLTDETIQDKK